MNVRASVKIAACRDIIFTVGCVQASKIVLDVTVTWQTGKSIDKNSNVSQNFAHLRCKFLNEIFSNSVPQN